MNYTTEWLRFQAIQKLADRTDVPYDEMNEQLAWMNQRDLKHARPGFDYWYECFKLIPSKVTMLDHIDEYIEHRIIGTTDHHCTNLNTVNIAMMAFINALKNKHTEICDRLLSSNPEGAVSFALQNPEDRWVAHVEAIAKKKGIHDKEAWYRKREEEQKAKFEENRRLCNKK